MQICVRFQVSLFGPALLVPLFYLRFQLDRWFHMLKPERKVLTLQDSLCRLPHLHSRWYLADPPPV